MVKARDAIILLASSVASPLDPSPEKRKGNRSFVIARDYMSTTCRVVDGIISCMLCPAKKLKNPCSAKPRPVAAPKLAFFLASMRENITLQIGAQATVQNNEYAFVGPKEKVCLVVRPLKNTTSKRQTMMGGYRLSPRHFLTRGVQPSEDRRK